MSNEFEYFPVGFGEPFMFYAGELPFHPSLLFTNLTPPHLKAIRNNQKNLMCLFDLLEYTQCSSIIKELNNLRIRGNKNFINMLGGGITFFDSDAIIYSSENNSKPLAKINSNQIQKFLIIQKIAFKDNTCFRYIQNGKYRLLFIPNGFIQFTDVYGKVRNYFCCNCTFSEIIDSSVVENGQTAIHRYIKDGYKLFVENRIPISFIDSGLLNCNHPSSNSQKFLFNHNDLSIQIYIIGLYEVEIL